jgi:hypothetical protein
MGGLLYSVSAVVIAGNDVCDEHSAVHMTAVYKSLLWDWLGICMYCMSGLHRKDH